MLFVHLSNANVTNIMFCNLRHGKKRSGQKCQPITSFSFQSKGVPYLHPNVSLVGWFS